MCWCRPRRPGLDATQVEALVTRPLEGLLAGTENVRTVRSTSSQGLSAIRVIFDRGGDPYRQRQVVTERLAEASGLLPAGVSSPQLSPLSSSMEYLVHFGFTSNKLSPLELRDLIEWVDQAADSRRAGRRAGADLRRRSARAAGRDRSAQARRQRAHARGCCAGDAPRDGVDRRRLHRNLDATHRRAGPGGRRDTGSTRRRRSSRPATACRCGWAMSPRSGTAPSRVSATR